MQHALGLGIGLAQWPVIGVLAISGAAPGGTVGVAYSFTPATSGGYVDYSFALTGSLPPGLSFSTTTGTISGSPTTAGTYAGLNITVTDAMGTAVALGAFSIVIAAAGPGGILDFTDPAGSELGIVTGVI